MSKARTLANFVSSGNPLADGSIAASEVTGLSTVATTGAYNDLSGKPTLGTAAAQNTTTFLQTANNLSDVTAATARTNLGLATVAATGSYDDLSNKPTITTTATNIAGGSNGTIPYQSAAGTTQMLAAGTAGQVLTSAGAAAPTWATPAPGAGTITAVATGSLSDGSKVVLNSDGTVSVASASSSSTLQAITNGTSASATVYAAERAISGAYGATDNVIVLFYINTSNRYLYVIAGKVSNSAISFGTPTAVDTTAVTNGFQYGVQVAWDAINNRFFCLYNRLSSSQGSFAVCKASASLAISDVNTFVDYWAGSAPYPMGYSLIISPTLNGSNNQAMIQYYSNNVGQTMYIPCTCINTSPYLNIGTEYVVDTCISNAPMTPCFGATPNIAVLAYRGGAGRPYISVVTLNGMSGTINNSSQLSADNNAGCATAVAYSPIQNKFFYVSGISSGLYGCVFTLSGTTPTIGTPAIIGGFGQGTGRPYSVVAYELTGTFWVGFAQYAAQIVVSGTTFTNGGINSFSYAVSTGATYGTFFYNPSDYTLVAPAGATAQFATATAYASTLTSTNFLGISNAAYTNGQTATIQTVGSTDDAQSGLTTGLKYYVAPNGTLSSIATSQPYAGLALSATKLVVKG